MEMRRTKRFDRRYDVDLEERGPIYVVNRRRKRVNSRAPPPGSNNLTQFRVPTSASFGKQVIGFPDRLGVTLKYSQAITLGPAATPSAQVFALNSLFDPDFSGIGHQPSYFDLYATAYARYFVHEVSMEVLLVNDSAEAVYWVAAYSDQNTSANSIEQLAEGKYAITGVLGEATAVSTKRIIMPTLKISQLMGVPDRILEADPNMYSNVGSSPTDIAWGIFKIASVDGTTSITCHAKFVLTFRVLFKDLLTQESS